MSEIPQHQSEKVLFWKKELKNHDKWKRYEFIFSSRTEYCRPLLEVLGSSKSLSQIMFPQEWEIPVFIGTQFGIAGIGDFPKMTSMYIAIIGRSALSGTLARLSIYRVDGGGREGVVGPKVFSIY